ncbi:carboxylate-amine ligase [Dichotomicrobium thermohalophilum]|uniref:Putative glutamate--cysteine ligase 2 n=1 Tax=Dichotomicrobium thermohalophilum TaxID=933063 RepID=A0A397PF24_9HYPH|nr:carboxylate-amine ligase [Dichotomicrobium thermohalophilum]RIA47558.1 carboxylate-amine ligase [Dichotomicrobium thermohalophilum]
MADGPLMLFDDKNFTIGIEEEYLLVDPATRDLVADPPAEMMEACQSALSHTTLGEVSPEFLRSQIEIGTRVCSSIQEARETLAEIRATLAKMAGQHGMALVAASTHPFAQWNVQAHTDRDRYNTLAEDLQVVVRRLLICGMHVHIGIDDDDTRIDLLNQAVYFMPHLLALSSSSPFWKGEVTGLKSYRLSVFDELPRTGLPAQFDSYGEYQRTVDVLVRAGVIEDATKVWWDLRPSAKFPTLEMRVPDICTLMDDAITIAALFACICRMLYRLRRENKRWRSYTNFLLTENRWRAQRYGIEKGMIDFGRGEIISFSELMEELLVLIGEDADALGMRVEVENVHTILARGTSADRQLAVYQAALASGLTERDAQNAVVDRLIEETVAGTSAALGPGAAVTAE